MAGGSSDVVDVWVTRVSVDVDGGKLEWVLREFSDCPSEEYVEAYSGTVFPVVSPEPVPRLELWFPGEGVVKVVTRGAFILREFEWLYEELRDRYDEVVAKSRVVGLSWARFIEENYGPGGLGVVREVRGARAERRRVRLSELHPLAREWFEGFLRVSEGHGGD